VLLRHALPILGDRHLLAIDGEPAHVHLVRRSLVGFAVVRSDVNLSRSEGDGPLRIAARNPSGNGQPNDNKRNRCRYDVPDGPLRPEQLHD
jgi:hypothetical protein